ncbi:MAG: pantoate--beta-alanine ligase [Clostridiales Family XIII bacterium]|jgi:pantoate--beta-alanine ligase|nr:pantoate--beta-alanine ligase [Clostridiales Family XIII bacterium]
MEIIRTVSEMKAKAAAWKAEGLSIGLVPTMGFLHEGHRSLVKRAVSDNDRAVVSIFVNPIQFGVNEDFDRYPRDLKKDADMCAEAGADVIFNPSEQEMYPAGFCSYTDMALVTEGLCGARRPGHFRGVCTVVMKLLNIAAPDRAYFGQKDAQQLAVIKRMTRDFNMDVEITGMPIVREADGLAMSSRNTYLSGDERAAALYINKALSEALRIFRDGDADIQQIKRHIETTLSGLPSVKIDYVEIVDAETMQAIQTLDRSALCAVAAYVGKTRLIDNVVLEV